MFGKGIVLMILFVFRKKGVSLGVIGSSSSILIFFRRFFS